MMRTDNPLAAAMGEAANKIIAEKDAEIERLRAANNILIAAINHACDRSDEGLEWLRDWNEGCPEAMTELEAKTSEKRDPEISEPEHETPPPAAAEIGDRKPQETDETT